MIKLVEEKDIKGMEEWLHPDSYLKLITKWKREKSGLKIQSDCSEKKIITLFQTLNCCMRMKMSWFTKAGTLCNVSKEHQ